jgi:hypothetical protein
MFDTEHLRKIYGIASGACFIAITQLAQRDTLQTDHIIALGCFASALPFCALQASTKRLDRLKKGSFLFSALSHFAGFSLPMVWLGVALLTFSFGWLVGLLFVGSSAIAWAFSQASLNVDNLDD